MDGDSLVLNFSAPTGDAPVTRLSKPKGGRWKDRVKVVKSVKRQLQVAGRPTPSHQPQPKEADRTPTPVQGRSNDNYDDFMEAGVSKEAKVMHGKSQVQSSIFSPDTEIIPKVTRVEHTIHAVIIGPCWSLYSNQFLLITLCIPRLKRSQGPSANPATLHSTHQHSQALVWTKI